MTSPKRSLHAVANPALLSLTHQKQLENDNDAICKMLDSCVTCLETQAGNIDSAHASRFASLEDDISKNIKELRVCESKGKGKYRGDPKFALAGQVQSVLKQQWNADRYQKVKVVNKTVHGVSCSVFAERVVAFFVSNLNSNIHQPLEIRPTKFNLFQTSLRSPCAQAEEDEFDINKYYDAYIHGCMENALPAKVEIVPATMKNNLA